MHLARPFSFHSLPNVAVMPEATAAISHPEWKRQERCRNNLHDVTAPVSECTEAPIYLQIVRKLNSCLFTLLYTELSCNVYLNNSFNCSIAYFPMYFLIGYCWHRGPLLIYVDGSCV